MNILNSKAGVMAATVLAGGLVLYFFGRRIAGAASSAVGAAVDAVSGVNEGTPYESWGALGTLGNAANTASGGVFEQIGSWLGGAIFDVFNKPYDPNNPNTPALRQLAQASSGVRPEDTPTIFIR